MVRDRPRPASVPAYLNVDSYLNKPAPEGSQAKARRSWWRNTVTQAAFAGAITALPVVAAAGSILWSVALGAVAAASTFQISWMKRKRDRQTADQISELERMHAAELASNDYSEAFSSMHQMATAIRQMADAKHSERQKLTGVLYGSVLHLLKVEFPPDTKMAVYRLRDGALVKTGFYFGYLDSPPAVSQATAREWAKYVRENDSYIRMEEGDDTTLAVPLLDGSKGISGFMVIATPGHDMTSKQINLAMACGDYISIADSTPRSHARASSSATLYKEA